MMASSRCETPNTMYVLAAENNDYRSESPNRPISRHSVGSRAGIVESGTPRRTPTPSKQVSLTSVRRKEDQSGTDEKANRLPTETPKRVKGFYSDVQAVSSRLNQKETSTSTDPANKASDTHESESKNSLNGDSSEDRLSADESDSSSEDEPSTPAPSQLLMEFLDCVMQEDYKNAEKLCKMILLYEPDNPEALKFKPLIEEKLLQEEEESEDDESEGEFGDESSDDDDSGDESSEESSDQSDSDDEDNSGNVQSQQPSHFIFDQ